MTNLFHILRMDTFTIIGILQEVSTPFTTGKNGTLAAPEEILLDVNKLAAGKNYCSVNSLSVSRNNKILTYGVDYVSRRRYTLNFLDIQSGSLLPDKIENTTGQSVWAADNITVFYVTKDDKTLRSSKIFKHKLGTPAEKDKLVYDESDETFSVSLSETKSRKYILLIRPRLLHLRRDI